MIPDSQIILRLLIAAGLSAVVGFERERQNQAAGLRTHIILGMGACLAMILSIYMAVTFHSQTGSADPARLAAQVVSGIGFLGAGAILRYGTNIKGLTTAASLWTVAVIGLAIGAGVYLGAVIGTFLLLVVLTIVNIIEERVIKERVAWMVTFQAIDHPGLMDQFKQAVDALDQKMVSTGFTKQVADNLMTIEATIETIENVHVDTLISSLSAIPGAHSIRIHS